MNIEFIYTSMSYKMRVYSAVKWLKLLQVIHCCSINFCLLISLATSMAQSPLSGQLFCSLDYVNLWVVTECYKHSLVKNETHGFSGYFPLL